MYWGLTIFTNVLINSSLNFNLFHLFCFVCLQDIPVKSVRLCHFYVRRKWTSAYMQREHVSKMLSRCKCWWLFCGLYEFWFCFYSFSSLALIEGRQIFWSCVLLNLFLTDRKGLFEAPEIWYESWRKVPQDDSVYMITKQRGLERAIYFWKKGKHTTWNVLSREGYRSEK